MARVPEFMIEQYMERLEELVDHASGMLEELGGVDGKEEEYHEWWDDKALFVACLKLFEKEKGKRKSGGLKQRKLAKAVNATLRPVPVGTTLYVPTDGEEPQF